MFSLFAPPETRQSVAFIENFRTSLFPWVLAPIGTSKALPVTFAPHQHGGASDWIRKTQKAGRNVALLMAETHGAVTGVKLVRGHLRGTRHFGVKLLASHVAKLDQFKPAPFLRINIGHWVYVAWRLMNECPVEAVEAVEDRVAKQLGGKGLRHFIPVAGTMYQGAMARLECLYKDRISVLTDFATPQVTLATKKGGDAPAALFTSAATITQQSTDWLWPNVFPAGALSLLSGQPKAGKTQVSLDCAARISAGLGWPTGERCATGGVAIFEVEDMGASSIVPRLVAAGADLSRIVIRDAQGGALDISEQMPRVASELAAVGGVRLLVLSPLLAFFGTGVSDDATIRRRLRPLLEWAANTGAAVLGIVHPPKRPGNNLEAQFAGADTYRRAARAAWVVMPDPADNAAADAEQKRRLLVCAGINAAADDLRLRFRIEGVEVDGIGASRIAWERGGGGVDRRSNVVKLDDRRKERRHEDA